MSEQLLKLPETPGTVIAIGDWWLVRLRPYEGAPSAWELLPFPDSQVRDHAERIGVKAQCVYGDEWVLAEAEQEGGYLIISDPRPTPSGIQYFTPSLKASAAPEPKRPVWDGMSKPPIHARVALKDDLWNKHGVVVGVVTERFADILWDTETRVRVNIPTENLVPEVTE